MPNGTLRSARIIGWIRYLSGRFIMFSVLREFFFGGLRVKGSLEGLAAHVECTHVPEELSRKVRSTACD